MKTFFHALKNLPYLLETVMIPFTNSSKIVILLLISSIISCSPVYRPVALQYKEYRISNTQVDSSLVRFLQPYSDSVNHSMNLVIAQLANDLEKKQPEGTLGNLMVDAVKSMAEKKYATNIDIAFVNTGGIRLSSIKSGPITKGKVFELMPFDNILVLQKLNGKILKELLDHIAGRGGWPVAGMTMKINNGKAVDILINGFPINENKIYTVAHSDYTANGGDNCTMLRAIPQINNGYLLRDALLDYFSLFTKEGKEISVSLQNRVTNVQ